MEIPDAVRALAVHPMRGVALPPDMRHVEVGGAVVTLTSGTGVQVVHIESDAFDVASAVAETRAVALEHGKARLGWLVTRSDDWVVPELERAGLQNRDVPGFEAVEHALALVDTPAGEVPDDVEVTMVSTWEQFNDALDLIVEVFETPPISDDVRRKRWSTYGERGFTVFASIEGRMVGAAAVAFGPSALTLLAGAVRPEARGRGVYTAMVHARWNLAVERGTPALVIQAGRLSRPICEKLGFRYLEPIRMFVDELSAS